MQIWRANTFDSNIRIPRTHLNLIQIYSQPCASILYTKGTSYENKHIFFRYHDTIEYFDEAAGRWTIIGELPTSRSWLSCVPMTVRKDMVPTKDKTAVSCIV